MVLNLFMAMSASGGRRSSVEEFDNEPLEVLLLPVKEGSDRRVPALHIGWAKKQGFVGYKPPPSAEECQTVLGAMEEWMDRMIFLEEDLHWLLSLPHHRFWSQAVFDPSVHCCLQSYLQHAPRGFDLADKQLPENVQSKVRQIHRLVFLVYVRLATYKESKTAHITPSEFGNLIYENYIFDIPTLMDLCVLYGEGNQALLCKMISNIFNNQPQYNEDLVHAVHSLEQVFDTVLAQLGIQLEEDGSPVPLSKGVSSGPTQCVDVIRYTLDTAATISRFVDVYPPAAQAFHNTQFEARIAHFYHVALPILHELVSKETSEDLTDRFDLTRMFLLKTFRSIIFMSCIQPMLDIEDDKGRECKLEELFATMSFAVSESLFICDYQAKFPFEEDIDLFHQAQVDLDPMKVQYFIESIYSCCDMPKGAVKENGPTSIFDIEEKFGRFAIDREPSASNSVFGEPSTSGANPTNARRRPRMDGVELESLVTQVQDLLPNLGGGFIESCLEHFDYNTERLINAVLEDHLPEPLQSLDRNMPRKLPKTLSAGEKILSERINVFDNDEFDVMHRDDVDTSKFHKGKRNKVPSNALSLLDDKSHLAPLRDMYSKYASIDTEGSIYDSNPANDLEYEDEYDDTYDEQAVGQSEPDAQEEVLNGRAVEVPRVLRAGGRERHESESEEEESLKEPARDSFVQDPAKLREQAEMRRRQQQRQNQPRQPNRPPPQERDLVGKPKGQGQDKKVLINRRRKEAGKDSRANHSRQFFASKKRSMGMIPS